MLKTSNLIKPMLPYIKQIQRCFKEYINSLEIKFIGGCIIGTANKTQLQ